MREWLAFKLMALIQKLLSWGKSSAPKKEQKEETLQTCPICGVPWEEKEIFCANCGYELRDEELPLNSPPERTGTVTDPDGHIAGEAVAKLRERFSGIASKMNADVAVIILPEKLRKALDHQNERKEYIDGLAYNLYNTWRIGKGTGLRGILLAVDPTGPDRALAVGKRGPKISGAKFRGWYSEMKPADNGASASAGDRLVAELNWIADKLSSDTG
jgi:uncharacterized Zn finger protein (UPF0148 family)